MREGVEDMLPLSFHRPIKSWHWVAVQPHIYKPNTDWDENKLRPAAGDTEVKSKTLYIHNLKSHAFVYAPS